MNPTTAFMQAREQLLKHREDYAAALAGFQWPKLERFNWAIDWFDELSRNNARPALRVVSETAGITEVTFAALADSSTRVARFFHDRGVRKGDRILVMLNNVLPLWETMLAAMKRPYTAGYYRALVDGIRALLPHASVGTDIIIGFPGETPADFDAMRDMLAKLPPEQAGAQ